MSRPQLLVLLGWALPLAAAALEEPAPSPAAPDSGLVFRLEIGSRLYPDWHEEQLLHLDEPFYLGDSEFTARIRRFVPDFRIGEKGEILSLSSEPNNPAVQVFVYHDSTAADSTWAFLNFPPHYAPRSFFTFRLKEVAGYRPAAPAAGTPIPKEAPRSDEEARKKARDKPPSAREMGDD
jgi:hypothetical protein